MGPVNDQRLADQQVALDVVMWLRSPFIWSAHGPVPRIQAVRAVVAQGKELVLLQAKLNVPPIVGREQSPRSVPSRGIAKDLANLLAALRVCVVAIAFSGASRRGDVVFVAENPRSEEHTSELQSPMYL